MRLTVESNKTCIQIHVFKPPKTLRDNITETVIIDEYMYYRNWFTEILSRYTYILFLPIYTS